MNNCTFIGRLTADPEITETAQHLIAKFSLAIDGYNGRSNFIDCIAFDKRAELIEKFISKGKKIGISAEVSTGSYTNKEGKKVYTTDFIVNSIDFCESKKEELISIPDAIDNPLPVEDNAKKFGYKRSK